MALRKWAFSTHHSTLKGLVEANKSGMLKKEFRKEDLSQWYVDNCEYKRFLKREEAPLLPPPARVAGRPFTFASPALLLPTQL